MRKSVAAALYTFALLGVVLTIVLVAALVQDIRAFDQTRGGYAPPYTDFTGAPTDWSRLDRTSTGMVGRGRLLNVLIDCRSGMITFEILGVQKQWRTFSPRALVVHQPRQACQALGFDPKF